MKHTDELLDWYLKRSTLDATESKDILQVVRDLAQLVAWQHFGECRGFSDRLLTPAHALTLARAVLIVAEKDENHRSATTVDERIRASILAEREACAMTVREMDLHGEEIAAAEAIRARSDK